MMRADPGARIARWPTPAAAATMAFPPVPAELAEATAYFAERLPIPFFCLDFLYDGERYWFSELEPDGVILPDWSDPAPHPAARRHPAPVGPPTATPTLDGWRPDDDRRDPTFSLSAGGRASRAARRPGHRSNGWHGVPALAERYAGHDAIRAASTTSPTCR